MALETPRASACKQLVPACRPSAGKMPVHSPYAGLLSHIAVKIASEEWGMVRSVEGRSAPRAQSCPGSDLTLGDDGGIR